MPPAIGLQHAPPTIVASYGPTFIAEPILAYDYDPAVVTPALPVGSLESPYQSPRDPVSVFSQEQLGLSNETSNYGQDVPPRPQPELNQTYGSGRMVVPSSISPESPTFAATVCASPKLVPPCPWGARLGLELGTYFDDLSRHAFQLALQSPGSWGVDLGVAMLWERASPDESDHVWLGDVNLTYELLSSENFRLQAGLGINWLADAIGAEAGLNFTVGAEWRVADCWYVTSGLDIGSLGDAELAHLQTSVGRRFDRTEVYVGFDHYTIGTESLNGITTGLRFRF